MLMQAWIFKAFIFCNWISCIKNCIELLSILFFIPQFWYSIWYSMYSWMFEIHYVYIYVNTSLGWRSIWFTQVRSECTLCVWGSCVRTTRYNYMHVTRTCFFFPIKIKTYNVIFKMPHIHVFVWNLLPSYPNVATTRPTSPCSLPLVLTRRISVKIRSFHL